MIGFRYRIDAGRFVESVPVEFFGTFPNFFDSPKAGATFQNLFSVYIENSTFQNLFSATIGDNRLFFSIQRGAPGQSFPGLCRARPSSARAVERTAHQPREGRWVFAVQNFAEVHEALAVKLHLPAGFDERCLTALQQRQSLLAAALSQLRNK